MQITDATRDIAWFLFANPWSMRADLEHFLGFPYHRTKNSLGHKEWFQRQSIAVHADGYAKRQHVYALTAKGHHDLIGQHHNMRFMADALCMTYRRLTLARHALRELIPGKEIHSLISPWKPGPGKSYVDALFELTTPVPGRPRLWLALIYAPEHAQLSWYVRVLQGWRKWATQTRFAYPFVLVLRTPLHFSPLTRNYLEEKVIRRSLPVLMYPTGRLDWSSLAKARTLSVTKTADVLWQKLVPIADGVMPDRELISDRRSSRPRWSANMNWWLQKRASKNDHPARLRLILSYGELSMLQRISLFPTFRIAELGQLIESDGQRSNRAAIIRNLAKQGLISEIKGLPGQYQTTSAGLELLAALEGISAYEMNRCLGYPGNPLYAYQEEHNRMIRELMLTLLSSPMVVDWRFMNARLQFQHIEVPGRRSRKNVFIAPDSTFNIQTVAGNKINVWLEFDRGTRRGPAQIRRQLEKYFLAHFAVLKPFPVPPILFVVENSVGTDATRLNRILEILGPLGSVEYPDTPLHMMFTSRSVLMNRQGPILSRRVWYHYHRGSIANRPKTLIEGVECVARDHASGPQFDLLGQKGSAYGYV